MNAESSYECRLGPYLDDIQRYCFFLTRSKWDGEDLFQETILRAIAYCGQTAQYQDNKPFLMRVAKNLWIDKCRTLRRRQYSKTRYFPTSYSDTDYAEIRGIVEWLSERLPIRNMRMWLLSEYFGYTMKEIALATHCSLSAVKSSLHRTRSKLCILPNQEAIKKRRISQPEIEYWTKAIMCDLPHLHR